MNQQVIYGIVVVLAIVSVILVAREIFCWHWKVNERIDLLDEQNQMLADIMNHFKIRRTN